MAVRRTASALAAVAVGLSTIAAPPPAQAASGSTRVQYLLDASSAMGAADQGGRPKFETARESIAASLPTYGSGTKVGLRTYGAKINVQNPKDPPSNACSDTEKLADPSGGGHSGVTDALNKYSAKGYAPIVEGIKQASQDLGSEGNRHIVVVSSGSFACSPTPCSDVAELRKGGMTAQVDVVAIGADENGHKQLACIAGVTGGAYVDATDTPSLTNTLNRLATRLQRGRDLFGVPIQGAGKGDTAPTLADGAYLDTLVSKQARYYKVTVPANASVFVSATVRPVLTTSYASNDVSVALYSSSDKCADGSSTSTATGSAGGPTVTAAAGFDPQSSGRSSSSSRACQGVRELTASVLWRGSDDAVPTPVQLVVSSAPWLNEAMGDVPGVIGKGFVNLPPPLDPSGSKQALAVPGPTSGGPVVVGGSGFPTAAELKPGTSQDTVTLGDLSYYKVKLDFGQSAILRVDSPSPQPVRAEVMAYGPRRGALSSPWDFQGLEDSTTIGGGKSAYVAAYVAPVRANNVFPSYQRLYNAAEPGYYYFAVSTTPDYDGKGYAAPTPVQLTLQVDGQAGEGKPASYVTSDIPGAVDPDAGNVNLTLADRVTAPAVLGFGLAGIGCIAAGAVWLVRRPRG